MNYLSHYYFDKSCTDSEYCLGLILPDLIRNCNKTWILKPEKYLGDYDSKQKSLYQGWQKHLKVDKLFHTSKYFKDQTEKLKVGLKPALSNSPVYSFFLSHITLELSLDSLLLTEEKINIHHFYNTLKAIDRNSLLDFLVLNKIQNPESFINFLEDFISYRYLEKYASEEELTYPLSRICYKLWKYTFIEAEISLIREIIVKFCHENRNNFLEIFDYIKMNLDL